ncbi:MAG: hypothetical protein HRU41_01535 [Saprospiraceae bacterium]|nr:hypothetical protein [Saprospiraceae bacterium]
MKNIQCSLYLGLLLVASSCKMADLSEHSNLPIPESERIAMTKLQEVIEAQGFEVLQQKNLYQFKATDHWPGWIGGLAKIWPDKTTNFLFRHNFNTFDGSALFLDGKKEGDLIGLQSWVYYEKVKDSPNIQNADTGDKFNKLEFGLVVFHYFLELPYRLYHAPIKRYYGQRKWKGQTYDLIFATWSSETANSNFDQYVLWINTDTHLVDYCIYTLRDNNSALTRHKYGSIAYQDYRAIEGFQVPFKMPILLDDGVVKKKSLDKYFHQFTIKEFTFGGFEEEELYPLPGIPKKIDSK